MNSSQHAAGLNWWTLGPCLGLALLLVVSGLFLLAGARSGERRLLGLGVTARTALGLGAAVAGYHLAAWTSPASWFPLHVPLDQWWVVLAGILLAAGSALTSERLERAERPPPGPDER
jgi:hypothetical protein